MKVHLKEVDKKLIFAIASIVLISLTLFVSSVSATTIDQEIAINGTLDMSTTYETEEGTMNQLIFVEDGVAYIKITYDDGSSKLQTLEDYITEHEGLWSQDTVGGGGISSNQLVAYIQGAIRWLRGETRTLPEYKDIGTALDNYFASDEELRAFIRQVYNDLEMMAIRIEALETTMERLHPDEYCTVKVGLLEKYGLAGVKCGANSTWYYIVPDERYEKGYYIMGITSIEESTTTTTLPPCVEDWVCTDWSKCDNEIQIRTCVDRNECGKTEGKPKEFQTCTVPEPTITGLFVSIIGNPLSTTIATLSAIVAILAVFRNRILEAIKSFVSSTAMKIGLLKTGLFGIGVRVKGVRPRIKINKPKINVKKAKIEFSKFKKSLKRKILKIKIPKIKLPKITMPSIEMPTISVPKITIIVPSLNLPSIALPKPTMPKLIMPKIVLPKIDLQNMGLLVADATDKAALLATNPFKYFSKILSFIQSKIFLLLEKIKN